MKLEKKYYRRYGSDCFFISNYDRLQDLTLSDLQETFADGADAKEGQGYGKSALACMVEAGTAPEVIVEMIKHGADLPNDFIYSEAIRSDIKEQLLLDQDIIGNSSDIPTFILAFHRPQLMKALTEYMPTEVLTAAIKYHRPEYVLPAIEAGADVNAMTSEPRKKDQVPLITFAAKYLDPQTLKYLIAAGAKCRTIRLTLLYWPIGESDTQRT